MGFIGACPQPGLDATLTAGEILSLAILGTAARGPTTLDLICLTIEAVAGHLYSPVTEVVAGQVERLRCAGALAPEGEQPGTPALSLTPAGNGPLTRLLLRPAARPLSTLGQVGLRLQLAFLDLLAPRQRLAQLQDAVAACRDQIALHRRRWTNLGRPGPYAQAWVLHEARQLHETAALLDAMATDCAAPSVPQSTAMSHPIF